MKKHMTATQARQQFFTIIQTLSDDGSFVTITHEGIPKVVMMSAEEFEGWMETLEIMSDPNLANDLRAALKEKETVTFEELKKSVRR